VVAVERLGRVKNPAIGALQNPIDKFVSILPRVKTQAMHS
jgi:hypothetical protein